MDDQSPRFDRGGHAASEEQPHTAAVLLADTDTQPQLAPLTVPAPTAYPRHRCVHDLVAEQAALHPAAIALVYGDAQLTYGDLDRQANRLAQHLQTLGASPDTLIGLYMERSIELVVSMLAVLKSGAAYVPLDPSYPAERLQFMLSDTQAPVVLTMQRFRSLLPPHAGQTIELDSLWPTLDRLPETAPTHRATADHLAYVMYTSGSTGRPKGISIPHHGITRLVCNTNYVQLTPADRVIQASNTAFDAATFEIWGALVNGARVVGVDRETALVPERFVAVLREQAITVAFMTTAWFNQVANLSPEAFGGLRALLFGGEACDPQRVQQVLSSHAPARLLHVYGPTESTTFSSWYPVTTVVADATTVPIGYPVANTQIYLLDTHGQQVPPGAVGELYIGGDGLARGYLDRPTLTAEKFVPDPFGGTPGSRLYRTGDLGRAQADGAIEFVGRIDDQIKLRGFRIELGEIETTLRQHPQVRDAVVMAREDQPGDMRLVAYVTEENREPRTQNLEDSTDPGSKSPGGHPVLGSSLRAFLGTRLPAYMVPSAFVFLDALPLTPNGKVDRKALPQPEPDRASLDTPLVAPRTPMEELVAQIWAEVLHLQQIGIHDNILELGVHSLLATQVVSRIRQQLGVALPIAALFEAPTIADLAQQIEAMRDSTRDDAPPLQPQPREGWLPLSFAQQRVWFFDQWLPNNPAYNLPFTYRLTGPLHVDALHKSLSAILRRHEALRTTFVASNGQPAQVIRPDTDLALPLVDLRPTGTRLPDADRETAARRLLSDEAHRPFDLARDLLIRALLLRLADDEHVLLLTIHHIIFDGWSEGVLLRELTALYTAYAADEPHPESTRLPELPIQYADFTLWQRELLQGAVLHQQLDYWRKQLTGVPVLDLPTDYPRPATLSFEGTQQRFLLPSALSTQLRALSRQEGVTLFMTLLATFQVLLHRYTGQHDIAVGSPIAGRTRREVEGLLGFFVNTLVLRSDLAGNPTFRALLRHVRDMALGAYAHQDVPFEQVLEAVQPERDLSFTPLFQVMFVLQNAPKTDLVLPGVQAEPIDVIIQNARFDLTVMLTDTDAGMVGQIEYNTQLFTAATMQRLSTHFEELLEQVVADPDQRIGWLPLLSAVEQQQILRDWNATAGPYPAQACIHQLFEEQVYRAPDAPAIVWMEHGQAQHTLSYAELNTRANQLAHALQARGVGPEMCVGVCLDRSPALVVALLAVLKAGGAYLPLDPAYPADRLKFMLDDSRAPLLITEQRLSATLPEHAAQVLWIDAEQEAIAQQPTNSPHSAVTARNLAYVIYTSGSTGRPKGVPLEHQGAANVAQSQVDVYGISPGERVLHSAALSFDASIFEVMMALLSGATLYQAPAADLMPGPALSALLRTAAITNITLTPSALSALPADDFSALRTVIAVGEASPAELVARWATDDRTVFNGYGPTEVTIWATSARVRPEGTPPPIGRPIINKRVYLLDAYGQPVPVGVPGEVCVAGVGLARGYLNRPDLTAQQFVPDSFGDDPGARLYKTGDLARYRPDGQIEYLGRIDHQVKIRGYRIELGEIEATLRQHRAVAEAAVIAREDAVGKRLVAYVVEEQKNKEQRNKEQGDSTDPTLPSSPIADEAEASRGVGKGSQRGEGLSKNQGEGLTSTLRGFLKERLPDYMVPNAFVMLDALPISANGKLNRRALPAPSTERPTLDSTFVAPRTALETILSGYWSEVLRLQQVGVHDNFFDLGGHSLLATQITSRISQAFQVPFPVPRLFEAPTVAGLAERLIADEPKPGQMEKIAQLLQRIKQMSPDARRNALHQKKAHEERS